MATAEIIGYLCSVLIGVALGLIGGGGSILTVPVLVYLFGVDKITATSYSLFIVGATSAIGTLQYVRQRLVNMPMVALFGMPSIIAVYATRAFLLPAIPNVIGTIGGWQISKALMIMILFAMLMIAASYSMIVTKNKMIPKKDGGWNGIKYSMVMGEGLVVGTLTGLVGAGGGFLIIPALVLLAQLPMKEAVGTSLVIIALKSLIGFAGEKGVVDWHFILVVTGFAIVGIVIGSMLSTRIDGHKLKPAFGWFVLAMGVYIIVKELLGMNA